MPIKAGGLDLRVTGLFVWQVFIVACYLLLWIVADFYCIHLMWLLLMELNESPLLLFRLYCFWIRWNTALDGEALIKHIWKGIYIYFVCLPSSALPILVLQVPEGHEAFIKLLLSDRSWILWQTWERECSTCIDYNKNGKYHPPFYLIPMCKTPRKKKWKISMGLEGISGEGLS